MHWFYPGCARLSNGQSLLPRTWRASHAGVKTGIKVEVPDVQPGASEAGELARAWRELRGDSDIQFAEVDIPPTQPNPPPDWLMNLLKWLTDALAPVGRALVASWPVLQWVLLALAIALVGYVLWRMFGPDLQGRRSRPGDASDWVPDQQAAMALLEDADRLAAEGRYDEATRLLLQRSVGQIAQARPNLIEPSSTAREIAAEPSLPANARTAFGIIADRVERSLFALRHLSESDWQAARAAYADFALAQTGLRA